MWSSSNSARISPTVVEVSLKVAMVSMASATVRPSGNCRSAIETAGWDMDVSASVGVASRYRGQQNDRILDGVQPVTGVRDDEQVPGPALPHVCARRELHATGEHVHGRLARVLVLAERSARQQRDHGLTQRMLMPAVNGRRGSCGSRAARDLELLAGGGVE